MHYITYYTHLYGEISDPTILLYTFVLVFDIILKAGLLINK